MCCKCIHGLWVDFFLILKQYISCSTFVACAYTIICVRCFFCQCFIWTGLRTICVCLAPTNFDCQTNEETCIFSLQTILEFNQFFFELNCFSTGFFCLDDRVCRYIIWTKKKPCTEVLLRYFQLKLYWLRAALTPRLTISHLSVDQAPWTLLDFSDRTRTGISKLISLGAHLLGLPPLSSGKFCQSLVIGRNGCELSMQFKSTPQNIMSDQLLYWVAAAPAW